MSMYIKFRAAANDKAEKDEQNVGLRIRNNRDFLKNDIETVREFYSRFNADAIKNVLVSFAEEAYKIATHNFNQ